MLDERIMYASAVLIAIGTYAYIKDMFTSDTRPNLVTWFLWAVAPMIAFTAQLRTGFGPAAFLTLMVGLCPLAVFIAGLRKGEFRLSRFDVLCGLASVLALVFWRITGSGTVAIVLSIAADGLAATPTLVKAYRDPSSESSFLFLLFALGAGLTLATFDSWEVETSGFPLYIFVLYVTLFALVKFELGTRAVATDKEPAND